MIALAEVNRLLGKAKAYAAAIAIAVPGLVTFITNWAESGEWDANEWRILLVTGGLALLTGGAVHQTPAGKAEVVVLPGSVEVDGDPPDTWDGSDDEPIPDQVKP